MILPMLETIVFIVVGVVLLFVFLLLFSLSRAARDVRSGRSVEKAVRRMKDPVAGELVVTGITVPSFEASFASAQLTGVLSADRVAPRPMQLSGLIATNKWPKVGQKLPVIVDRADPDRYVIEWFKIKTGTDAALDEAERLAREMRMGGGAS